jgi:exosome complex RNA-binding protein Rrp4
MKSNTNNSYNVPSYIVNGLKSVASKDSVRKKAFAEAEIRKAFAEGKMSKIAFLEHVESIDHGHGVREALADFSVWKERNGVIYRTRESQREVEAVLKLINKDKEV